MRETCARVLAAALMTGAIATVVAMSALFDTPQEVGRALTAPPSSLQRSVRLGVLLPAPRHAPAAERLVSARTRTSAPARTVIVSRQLVRRTSVGRHRRPPRRQLAAVQPKPATVVQPAPAPAPAPQAAAATPAPPDHAPSKRHDGNGHGNDHADDHGHGHDHGHGEHED